MTIALHDSVRIQAIQEEFNEKYPFLKLKFASKSAPANSNLPEHQLRFTKTLGEYRSAKKGSQLIIHPHMTVKELEEQFVEIYGLQVQVLRKSGRAWLETTVTDGWTLEEQNKQGAALNKAV